MNAPLPLLLMLAAVLAGCAGTPPKRDPAYAPPRPLVREAPAQATGAIYQAGHGVAWFEDLKARRVGDTLTVTLVESTNAQKSATSATAKSNSNSIANPTILGSTPQFNTPTFIPLASNRDNTFAFGTSSEHDFSGSGTAAQSNALSGNITVTVVEVLANGHLAIRGEKRVGINQGNEYIRLSGIVRPYDINPDNSIASTRIADPTIVYVGDGQLAEANAMGWLARFFTSALFPF